MPSKMKQTLQFIKKHKTLTASVLLVVPILIQSIRKIRQHHNSTHRMYY